MVSRFSLERPKQIVRAGFERALDRLALPTETRPLYPIVKWDLLPELRTILDDPKHQLAVGSVVAAGHMPNGFSDEMLQKVGVTRNADGLVERISRDQIKGLHRLKRQAQEKGRGKDGPFRFIDTMENIQRQENKLYKKLKKKYEREKRMGADKVLFSVCAISAGFDLNYSSALVKLMKEVGPENIVFSIFLPFSIDAVTGYSVQGQGVNPKYWEQKWQELLGLRQDKHFRNSIFIHEPQLLPAPLGKEKEVSPASVSNVNSIHQRGQDVNGNPNTVYSDVNRKLVGQALYAVKWNTKKIYGIFAEAFQTSKALLGGGPEIMAMLLYAGVPPQNLDIVQAGLTEFKKFGRTRALIQYLRKFRPLMKAWDSDPAITAAWGPDYAPLRRRK